MIKDKFMSGLKWIKALWDTYKIVISVVALLTSLGIGTYAAYEPEPIPAPVIIDESSEYALKGHAHPEIAAAIKRALTEYDERHDPQQLKH